MPEKNRHLVWSRWLQRLHSRPGTFHKSRTCALPQAPDKNKKSQKSVISVFVEEVKSMSCLQLCWIQCQCLSFASVVGLFWLALSPALSLTRAIMLDPSTFMLNNDVWECVPYSSLPLVQSKRNFAAPRMGPVHTDTFTNRHIHNRHTTRNLVTYENSSPH